MSDTEVKMVVNARTRHFIKFAKDVGIKIDESIAAYTFEEIAKIEIEGALRKGLMEGKLNHK